jgi:hypothetical protein
MYVSGSLVRSENLTSHEAEHEREIEVSVVMPCCFVESLGRVEASNYVP